MNRGSITDILDSAEALDGYRHACAQNPLNAEARAKQDYSLFFDPDADKIAALANTIPICNGADLAILHPSADNGFPHTRPNNIICLPAGFLSNTSGASAKNTLIHEAIHLHQRANPELWNRGVQREGWTRISPAQVPPHLLERCRINPDTMGRAAGLWAWGGFHVPLPLFVRDDRPTLNDVVVKWLDLRNGVAFPRPPPTFTARYGMPPQPEHPFELLAVEFSEKGMQTDAEISRGLK